MANLEELNYCCGIHELYYVRDSDTPEDLFMDIDPDELRAHVIFSTTTRQDQRHRKGIAFANFIRKHGLGELVETPKPVRNPGHHGTLKAWLWTPRRRPIRQLQRKLRKQFPEKYDPNWVDPNTNNDPYTW